MQSDYILFHNKLSLAQLCPSLLFVFNYYKCCVLILCYLPTKLCLYFLSSKFMVCRSSLRLVFNELLSAVEHSSRSAQLSTMCRGGLQRTTLETISEENNSVQTMRIVMQVIYLQFYNLYYISSCLYYITLPALPDVRLTVQTN